MFPNDVLDNEVEEKTDGPEDGEVEAANEDGLEPGEGADKDGGGEAGDVSGDGEKTGDEAEAESVEETLDPRDEKITALETQLKELGEKVNKPAPAAEKVYSEAEKEAISARFGGASFETVNAFNALVVNGLQMLEQKVLGEMSVFKKESAIVGLSKEKDFADIQNYMPGVNEFLKRFNPSFHSNPEVLKDAYWYAKGKGLKTTVKKIVNSQEKNRRVASSVRSPSGNKGGNDKKSSLKLTPGEKEAYERFGKGTFDSEEEYAISLPRNRRAA